MLSDDIINLARNFTVRPLSRVYFNLPKMIKRIYNGSHKPTLCLALSIITIQSNFSY